MLDYAADNAIFLADSAHTAQVAGFDPVSVIYNAPYKPVAMYGEEVVVTAPACSMLDADIERLGIAYGTALGIYKGAVLVGNFTVTSSQPDSHGLSLLTLTFAEA